MSRSLHGLPQKATDLCIRRVLLHRSLKVMMQGCRNYKIAHVEDSSPRDLIVVYIRVCSHPPFQYVTIAQTIRSDLPPLPSIYQE
jgi:hypothetical protein